MTNKAAFWITRSKYISLTFPFNLSGLENNVFTDPQTSYIFNANTSYIASSNMDNLQLFNFNSLFDIVRLGANNSVGKYVSGANAMSTCSTCTSCYSSSSSSCLTCNRSNSFIKSDNSCSSITGTNYYNVYSSPLLNNNNLQFKNVSLGTKITVTFYVKILGFQDVVSSDIITYGSNLKLIYDHTANTLSLVRYSDMSVTFATVNNFSSFFGKYVFISLSYQYDSTMAAYYPPMLNFMVDNVNLTINNNTAANLTNISMQTITIPNKVFGLFAKLYVYSNFLIGAYGYETNKYYFTNSPTLTPAKKLINDSSTSCITTSDLIVDPTTNLLCYTDYDVYFDQGNYVSNIYGSPPANSDLYFVSNGAGSTKSCSTTPLCYETCFNQSECSCRTNSTNYWLFKNNNAHKCQSNYFLLI